MRIELPDIEVKEPYHEYLDRKKYPSVYLTRKPKNTLDFHYSRYPYKIDGDRIGKKHLVKDHPYSVRKKEYKKITETFFKNLLKKTFTPDRVILPFNIGYMIMHRYAYDYTRILPSVMGHNAKLNIVFTCIPSILRGMFVSRLTERGKRLVEEMFKKDKYLIFDLTIVAK